MSGFGRGSMNGRGSVNGRGSMNGARGHKRKHDNSPANFARYVFVINFIMGCQGFNIDAFNCNSESEITMVPSPCMAPLRESFSDLTNLHLIYETSSKQVRKGIRCSVKVKLDSYLCGTYSHIHLLDIPRIYHHFLGKQECEDAYDNKRIDLFGKTYEIKINETIEFSRVLNGSINIGTTLGSYNSFCYPDGVIINGKTIPSGFRVGSFIIEITRVALLFDSEWLYDLDSNSIVGLRSVCSRYCYNHKSTYVLLTQTSEFRHVNDFQGLFFDIDGQKWVKNKNNSLVLRVNPFHGKRISGYFYILYQTELFGLWVAVGTIDNLEPLHNLEESFSIDSYLRIFTEKTLLMEMFNKNSGLYGCLSLQSRHYLPNRIYALGKIIYHYGEILEVHHCTKIEVQILLENFDCYIDHIEVMYKGERFGLQSDSRILKKVSTLKKLECSKTYLYIWVYNNTYIKLTEGKVVFINVTLSDQLQFYHEIWAESNKARTEIMMEHDLGTNIIQNTNTISEFEILSNKVDEISSIWSFDNFGFTWIKEWILRVCIGVVIIFFGMFVFVILIKGLYALIVKLYNYPLWTVNN